MKRKCNGCGVNKDLPDFVKSKRLLYGYGYECKECMRKRGKARYEKAEERIVIKERHHNYYLKHKEDFIRRSEKWQRENPEAYRASRRRSYQRKMQYSGHRKHYSN